MTAPSSKHRVYAYPDVGTFGLGHSLLAWGRCRLWCDRNAVPMLAPNWLHVQGRLGPWRRRERDNRLYHLLFQFPGHVTGLRRWWLLTTQRRIAAEDTDLHGFLARGERGLVVFKNRLVLNEETHFKDVIGHGAELKKALMAITRPQHLPAPALEPHIALHVRMGDFSSKPSMDALRRGEKNSRIPVQWYADMLNGLRRTLGQVPARLYSDGSDGDLAPLLSLEGVRRAPKAPSITDLLGMSQAKLLISSGSGFSMWGAFLGDVPRICFPGQRFTRVLAQTGAQPTEREPECESWRDVPADLVAAIAAQMRPA